MSDNSYKPPLLQRLKEKTKSATIQDNQRQLAFLEMFSRRHSLIPDIAVNT